MSQSVSAQGTGCIRFVVYRYGHHSPHSGYSRLAEFGCDHFQAETIQIGRPLSRRIIRERFLWRLAAGTPGYDRSAMAAELAVARRMVRERGCIYHFLYGETTYRHVGMLNNIRHNRVVASFHQPPSTIAQAVQIDTHLRRLSAVVCVGRNQRDFFANVLPPDRIFVVPLGVDIDYFTPPPSNDLRDPDLCLCVGENYRDFPTLRGVIELVAYRRPQTRFVLVSPPHCRDLVGTHPRLSLRSGIPEEEFRELYRSAALMVMPLLDATANNAVLESMACGLPLVVTDVGAIRDYVSPEGGVLIPPGDARRMADAVVEVLEDRAHRDRLSREARAQALRFAWPDVTKQLATVYNAVA